jgi:hypothetical protein|tara:strand:+ start:62 stop:418 length:357 start_codon:yes stop_codon:yes gene_type:complete
MKTVIGATILLWCTLIVASFYTAIAVAGEMTSFTLTTKHMCGPKDSTERILAELGRIPFAEADSIVQHTDGQDLPGQLKIYVNPQDWTFAIMIINPAGNIWCVMTEGKNFRSSNGITL